MNSFNKNQENEKFEKCQQAVNELKLLKQEFSELRKKLEIENNKKSNELELYEKSKNEDNLSENHIKMLFNISRYFGSTFYQWNKNFIYIIFNSSNNGIYNDFYSLKFDKSFSPYKINYDLPFSLPKQDVKSDEEAVDQIIYAYRSYKTYEFRKNQYDELKTYFEENNISLFHSFNFRLVELTFMNEKGSKINLIYPIDSKKPEEITTVNIDSTDFDMEAEDIIELFESYSIGKALDTLLKK